MRRDDFIENICDFGDLINFCYENGLEDSVQDIYHDEDDCFREMVDDMFVDDIRECGWRTAYGLMEDFPDGYDWYEWSYHDTRGLDDYDFQEWKDNVLIDADNADVFDYEEEEGEDECEYEEEPCEPDENSREVDVCGLIAMNVSFITMVNNATKEEEPSVCEQLFG